jgi:competence protein ComEA
MAVIVRAATPGGRINHYLHLHHHHHHHHHHHREFAMLKKILAVLLLLVASMGLAMADVDVNLADQAGLDGVTGIGAVMSKKILDERKAHGPFADWADFQKRVKGIGDKNSVKLSQAGLRVNGQAKGAPAAAPAVVPASVPDAAKPASAASVPATAKPATPASVPAATKPATPASVPTAAKPAASAK